MATQTQKSNMKAMNAMVKAFLGKAQIDSNAYDALLESWEGEENQAALAQFFKNKKKTVKDPDRPKRPLSAYLYFCRKKRAKVKKKLGDDATLGTVSKKLGALWKKAKADDEVDEYNEMAAKDKTRYEEEMESYTPPSGEEIVAKRKRKRKSGGKKRGKSAYILFCADERPKIKTDHPDMTPRDVMKELGKRWRQAKADDEVGKYIKMAAKDKAKAPDTPPSSPKHKVIDDEEELEEELPKKAVKKKAVKKKAVKKKAVKKKAVKKVQAAAYWRQQNRDEVAEDTELEGKALTKKLRENWKALSKETKEEWKQLAITAAKEDADE